MSNRLFRQIIRIAHLVEGVLIGVYFYSPLGSEPFYGDLIRFVVLPMIVVSGLVMWQQPKVVKLLRRQRAA
jgi:hypothetical protein